MVKTQYEVAAAATACSTGSRAKYYDAFRTAKQTEGKQARAEAVPALKEQAMAEMIPDPKAEGAITAEAFATAWHDLEERVVRDLILAGTRPDGRDYKTLRPIECKVDVLPRVHGSAVFQRGETQALVTVTLGTGRDEQRVDGLVEEYSQEVHARLLLPAVLGGRVPADPRPGPPRNRPRVPWPSGASSRCCPIPRSSPTRSASSPTSSNRTAPARWPASAGRRWA